MIKIILYYKQNTYYTSQIKYWADYICFNFRKIETVQRLRLKRYLIFFYKQLKLHTNADFLTRLSLKGIRSF